MAGPTAPASPWQDEDLSGSAAARFEKQVRCHGGRLALRSTTESWTYEELDRWVNRIASSVLEIRGDRLEPMALLLGEGASSIAGILGAHKAGKISLHLDASLQPERLQSLIEDSGAGLLLSGGAALPAARAAASAAGIPLLDIESETVGRASEKPPGLYVPPDSPAYIIYTSGSTGRPNGVANSHRNLLWGTRENTRRNGVTEHDRILLVASPGSGQGTGIFQSLLNGAALYPFDIEAEGLPKLRNWIQDEEITVYHSVPAVFRALVRTFREGDRFPKVRHFRLGGDTIRREDLQLFQRHFEPTCLMRIGYSCTETGVISCHFIGTATPIGDGPVPVGRVVEEVDVRLLDESGREVPEGEAGEITVRSRHLALGYWRRAELTRERFRPDPAGGPERIFSTGDMGRFRPDGFLVHLGRKDFQVKIRGFRVETGEVEAALRKLPGVEDAAVAAPPDASGEKRLVGYVVWNGPSLPWRTVRAELLKKLPDHMVPAAFVTLPRLPLTARGKVDFKALPPPPAARGAAAAGDFVGPRNDSERRLAEIWARLLKVERIDVRSDFFELGGDSLLAVELFAEIERRMNCYLPLSVFAESTTVESLAERLANPASHPWPTLVPLQPLGTKAPFFCVHTPTGEVLGYRTLAHRLGPDRPVYGLRCERFADGRPRYQSIEEMAARYVEEIRAVRPTGPYHIGGLSGGASIAFEMAQQLRAAGQEVGALVLMDPPGLDGYDGDSTESSRRGVLGRLHTLGQWIHFYWTKLRLLERAERGTYVREKSSELFRKVARGENLFSKDAGGGSGAPAEIRRKLPASLRRLLDPYHPRAYPGSATVFLARWQPMRSDRLQLWRTLVTAGLEVRVVPGFHAYIVEEPFVRVLARQIEECLSRAEAVRTAAPGC
jgi:amino acid adenylation domain-containing protein